MATAATVARSLISSGPHVSFYHGYNGLPELAKPDEAGRWTRGIVLVGPLADAVGVIAAPIAKVAGAVQPFGMLAAVRIAGQPALLVSDGDAVRAGRLFASPLLAATRGIASATVGEASPLESATDHVTFDQLAVAPAQAEVFGRADLAAVVDTRRLPGGTRPTRLLLDVMVAPDGAGEKAVVSVFVNKRLLGSTVAASGEPTHLDLPLPDGLVGTIANVRALVQRDSAQGDCRFEPQGYPAQILGSSSLMLESAAGAPHDFSDLTSHFARGLELRLPPAAPDQPGLVLGLVAEVVNQLAADLAPISVNFVAAGSAAGADAPFIVVSDVPPAGTMPRVRFDRGRVAVTDRSGRTLLDLGGFVGGAVAQIVTAGDNPGLWIKPLSADGSLPAPSDLHLDHGDVAFVDANGGPETVLFARGRWGTDIEFVVVSKFDIVFTVQTAFAAALSRRAVFDLAELDPQLSAHTVFTTPQMIVAYALLSAVLAGLAFAPIDALIFINIAISIFYLGNFVFKGILALDASLAMAAALVLGAPVALVMRVLVHRT